MIFYIVLFTLLIVLINNRVMITPIILSGGNGTRLWPMSRTSKPKQFISFINNDSMFTQTVKRFSDKNVFNDVIILGNIKH